jgi:glyoxylase-like metal-dependent hydrolase (beta-lactamase superfamily II)
MSFRAAVIALGAVALAACAEPPKREPTWQRVTEHVWRSPGTPAAYALVDGDGALLFGAPEGADPSELQYAGITALEGAYLTHHHRDSVAQAAAWAATGIPVRAPRASAPWLTPEGVHKFWRGFLPSATPPAAASASARLLGTWDYLVAPAGLAAVDCSLDDGAAFDWRGWRITPVATPGHSRGHMAFAARRAGQPTSKPLVFCGDALASPGKLWTPYTTEWDPAGDDGLKAAAASLRALLLLDPAALFPEHGEPILEAPGAALLQTAEAAAAAGFLKSYERYTERRGDPPAVRLFDRTQIGTDGRKPWTRLTGRLHFTGSTYALASRNGGLCLVDPAGDQLSAQVVRAQLQRIARDLEIAVLTHPHADHYGAAHEFAVREGLEIWALDEVAAVIAAPAYRRAPHAHPRPLTVDRTFRDGQRVAWNEFTLTFRRLPGHSQWGSVIFAEVDDRKVAFVGDAFLHPQHDGGTGGWAGLNGGFPSDVADSAALLLAERPHWVLASRGGAFEFVAADWERRLAWAQEAARACDRLSTTGRHRADWNPGLVRVEPFAARAATGEATRIEIVAENPLEFPQTLTVEIPGRGLFADIRRLIEVPPGGTVRMPLSLSILDTAIPGPQVLPLRIRAGGVERGDDAYFVLEVERP